MVHFILQSVKLALNADKIKLMLFSNARWKPVDIVTALEEDNNCYKYQRIWLLECLSFKQKKGYFPKCETIPLSNMFILDKSPLKVGEGLLPPPSFFLFFFYQFLIMVICYI